MTNIEKRIGLLGFFARGLVKADVIRTKLDLGDRSTYLGMSDLAGRCRRSVVASKVLNSRKNLEDLLSKHVASGNEEAIQEILRQMVTFSRGHAWEHILGKGFAALGVNRIPQLEVRYIHEGAPIIIHMDDCFVFPDGSVRILEYKCNEEVQDDIYPENEFQLYGQLGFIQGLWGHPCFAVKADGQYLHAGLTFPQLVDAMFGIKLPSTPEGVNLEGYVVSATLNPNKSKKAALNPFGPYVPNAAITKECLDRAKWIWKDIQDIRSGLKTLDDLWVDFKFNPLCDFCDHWEGCPKFKLQEIPELEADLTELYEKKQQYKALEADIKRLEAKAKVSFDGTMKAQSCFEEDDTISYITDGIHTLKFSVRAGRKTIDKMLLESSLTNLTVEQLQLAIGKGGLTADMVEELIESSTKQGDPFTVCYVNKPKQKITKVAQEAEKLAA